MGSRRLDACHILLSRFMSQDLGQERQRQKTVFHKFLGYTHLFISQRVDFRESFTNERAVQFMTRTGDDLLTSQFLIHSCCLYYNRLYHEYSKAIGWTLGKFHSQSTLVLLVTTTED